MSSFKHLLIFDLTKLGAAYQIINSFVDDEVVNVFEVSPLGSHAVLILASNDLITLRFIEKESLAFFKNDILSLAFLEAINEKIVQSYLGQSTPVICKHLAVLEESSFAFAFEAMAKAVSSDLQVVDFKAVRTTTPNLVMTFTSDSIQTLGQIANFKSPSSKLTIIENVQKPLKSYFQILN